MSVIVAFVLCDQNHLVRASVEKIAAFTINSPHYVTQHVNVGFERIIANAFKYLATTDMLAL